MHVCVLVIHEISLFFFSQVTVKYLPSAIIWQSKAEKQQRPSCSNFLKNKWIFSRVLNVVNVSHDTTQFSIIEKAIILLFLSTWQLQVIGNKKWREIYDDHTLQATHLNFSGISSAQIPWRTKKCESHGLSEFSIAWLAPYHKSSTKNTQLK